MSEPKRGYLLGLGSNIAPEENFARIVDQLLHRFDVLHLSRVLNIPPIGMNSHRPFLNAVAFIETDMPEEALKIICNQIETSLGRDRADPDSKIKDRPADLDILAFISLPAQRDIPARSLTDEYFLYPLIDELTAFLCDEAAPAAQPGCPISCGRLRFGESATTIYRNGHARQKRVV